MMKLDELLQDAWGTFLNKNLKWLIGVLLRYGVLLLLGILFLVMVGTYVRVQINEDGAGFVLRKGKTINISKPSKDTNVVDIKEIDDSISFLKDLRKKAQEGK